jgi:hypothetical protein
MMINQLKEWMYFQMIFSVMMIVLISEQKNKNKKDFIFKEILQKEEHLIIHSLVLTLMKPTTYI